jgi:TrmH family RNA methyltransferase
MDGVHPDLVVGPSTDPYSPAAVKASMGSLFAVPVVHAARIEELLSWARRAGLSVVTTSARARTLLDDVAVALPAVVLFGNEGAGLAPDVLDSGDVDVRIPMMGSASSLNLAVAAGIILYAAARRKRMD